MPVSEKQLAANRANARKSHGATTPGGRRNSSLNSLKHGMFAQAILLPGESRERFPQLLSDLTTEFDATTPSELVLVETMPVSRWRVLAAGPSRPPKSPANSTSRPIPPLTKTHPPKPSPPSTP
jgi:hypothetical protein